jgi:hypothetical protein
LRRDEISLTDHVAVAGLEFESSAWSLDHLESTSMESLMMEKTQEDYDRMPGLAQPSI